MGNRDEERALVRSGAWVAKSGFILACKLGEIHDFRRAAVLPAKRNLAVEVERENVFIPGPLVGWLWHLRRLTDGMEKSREPFTNYAGWYLTAKNAKTRRVPGD